MLPAYLGGLRVRRISTSEESTMIEYITTHLRQLLRIYLVGFAMGVADLIPGVSGGTIAFIFGIYDELLTTIKVMSGKVLQLLLKGQVKEAINHVPWSFAVPLACGLATAVLLFSGLIEFLFEHHPAYLKAFFFGLVLASIGLVAKRIPKWTAPLIVTMLGTSVATYFLLGMRPVSSPQDPLTYFMSGAIAITAMILPGISGSFILLILGKYRDVLGHVNALKGAVRNPSELASAEMIGHFVSLAALGLGIIIGISLFARVLTWLLKQYHDPVVTVLTGFMVGSLRVIWPWFRQETFQVEGTSKTIEYPINILPSEVSGRNLVLFGLIVGSMLFMLFMERFNATAEHHEDLDEQAYRDAEE